MRTRVLNGSADKQPFLLPASGSAAERVIEEYLLEDARFRGANSGGAAYNNSRSYYPSSLPGQMPKAAKLKTVSIIDTLSELARGGVELEREQRGHSVGSSPPFLPLNEFEKIPNLGDLDRFNGVSRVSRAPKSSASSSYKPRPDAAERRRHGQTRDEEVAAPNDRQIRESAATYREKRALDVGVSGGNPVTGRRSDKTNELFALRTTGLAPASLQIKHHQDKVKSSSGGSKSVVNAPTFNRFSLTRAPTSIELVRAHHHHEKAKTVTAMGVAGLKGHSKHHHPSGVTVASRNINRSCFSDSEIDATDFLTSIRANQKTTPNKNKCSSDDCLDWDESDNPWDTRHRSRVKPIGTSKNQDRLSASVLEETDTSSRRGIGQFSPGKGLQRYPKKHRMPEWIRSLFKTAKQGNLEMLKHGMTDMDSALVRNLSDHSGNSLWHLCAAHNHLACVQWLCNKFGPEGLEDENKSGQKPVILAVKFGSLSVVQWLFERETLAQNILDSTKRSLLHYAAKYGQAPVLNWILNYSNSNGTDVNQKDVNGNTPLHMAAKYGHIQCAKELVLQNGDITLRNEAGLKPYDVAIRNNFKACAEYLLSVEATISLATEHCILKGEIHRSRNENSDGRKMFRDLLHLVKSSLRHQREMLESLKKMQEEFQQKEEEADDHSAESEKGEDRRNDNIHTEFQSILSQEINRFYNVILLKDQNACQTIEDKWKRLCRKNSQHAISAGIEPLEILRSQFARVQAKATRYVALQDVEVASSSESSLSGDSGDEMPNVDLSDHGSFAGHLADLPRSGGSRSSLATSTAVRASFPSCASLSAFEKTPCSSTDVKKKRVNPNMGVSANSSRVTAVALPDNRPWSYHAQLPHSDVDLRVLFDRNPELKQEGRTCSVLEVLEPSSSENEELSQIDKHFGAQKMISKTVAPAGSSAESANASPAATKLVRSPLRIKPQVTKNVSKPSTSNSKNGPGSSVCSLGGKDRNNIADSSRCALPLTPSKPQQAITITLTAGGTSREVVKLPDGQRKIQVSQHASRALPSIEDNKDFAGKNSIAEFRERKQTTDASSNDASKTKENENHSEPESSLPGSPQISLDTGSESCTSSSSPENSDSTGRSEVASGASTQSGTVLKKKGFLLKFSLKNRWSSKQKQRGSKKSSESSGVEDSLKDGVVALMSPHQDGSSNLAVEAHSSSSQDSLSVTLESSLILSTTDDADNKGTGEPTETMASTSDGGQHAKKMERFLPPPPPPSVRREPPPMPPVDENDPDYERPMDPMDITPNNAVLPDILSASNLISVSNKGSSDANKEESEDTLSSKDRYCSASEISRLYCSTGKIDSRPPSSASRIDSSLRSDDTYKSVSFPLSKMSSASTELLVTPDSSTAGRQSPAPSEVSKTESALSPPSDVSKTESHRHTNHLGRIDEILNVKKNENDNTPTTILDISQVSHCQDSNQDSEEMKEYETIPESVTSDEFRQSTSTNKKRLRPWYEVSDDEDILTPGRFKPLGGQSTSEEEDNTVLR